MFPWWRALPASPSEMVVAIQDRFRVTHHTPMYEFFRAAHSPDAPSVAKGHEQVRSRSSEQMSLATVQILAYLMAFVKTARCACHLMLTT